MSSTNPGGTPCPGMSHQVPQIRNTLSHKFWYVSPIPKSPGMFYQVQQVLVRPTKYSNPACTDMHHMSPNPCSIPLCSITKKLSLNRWQKRWNTATTGRFTYDLFPKTRESNYKSVGTRANDIKLNRLRSGTSLLLLL